TVRRELQGMGFHGRAAASKPYITNGVKHAATGLHWSSGNAFSGVTNRASPSGNLKDKRTVLCKVWWRGGYGVWLFFRSWLGSLVPVKGTLNASACQDILDNSMLPTLWEQFGAGPFLFQHDCAPVHKARSIKTWMTESGVDELDWPAQSPDLNPIEHLWDELERRLRARPSRPTSVCDLTNALLKEWSKIPIKTLLNLVDSLPRRVEAVIAAKGGPTSY
ncbi:hypothetical protein M9458_053477, partial [Cirrhinus mrigala]